ncbi:MAG TPA: NADPH-dependent F420 reductase [Candidatus Bathyarchaeia archaeon]|nr:NADPH-dependent F420 reductase [Candidatus Bathyarchaeia archaeon]
MSNPTIQNPNLSLAIIGGTGKEGSAIAARFAKAGVRTLIGSRDAAKAQNMANTINTKFNIKNVEGYTNRDATAKADIVLLAIPYDGMKPILEDIKPAVPGKIIINIASSLDQEKKSRARINPAGSIAAEIQQFFGENAKVVDAFQNISPEQLEKFDEKIETDVLVVGADREARDLVIGLIKKIGIDAFDAGMIQNAVVVETMTAALIAINIRYKVKGAGIRIVGVPRS